MYRGAEVTNFCITGTTYIEIIKKISYELLGLRDSWTFRSQKKIKVLGCSAPKNECR